VLVAAEVAEALGAPLDVLVVRKIGPPHSQFGAVAEGGVAIVDHDRARASGLGAAETARLRDHAEEAADATAQRLRMGATPYDLVGRTVVLIDDGVDSGDSAIVAARTARRRGAARIVVAAPISGARALVRVGDEVDEVVCVEVAANTRWYEHGERPAEREVLGALRRPRADDRLYLPEAARGVIVLAGHDELVVGQMHDMGFATLALTSDGDAEATLGAARRLRTMPATEHLRVGAFGFGARAETVLQAGASDGLHAIVTAGGRPDRATPPVSAATLLIVGAEDRHVLALARATSMAVAVVPGATHEFVEPGALEQVAHLAGGWFAQHLARA